MSQLMSHQTRRSSTMGLEIAEHMPRILLRIFPRSRSGYETLCRIKAHINAVCTEAWLPKKRPSKDRKRSAKDKAAPDAWFAQNRREVRDELKRRTRGVLRAIRGEVANQCPPPCPPAPQARHNLAQCVSAGCA